MRNNVDDAKKEAHFLREGGQAKVLEIEGLKKEINKLQSVINRQRKNIEAPVTQHLLKKDLMAHHGPMSDHDSTSNPNLSRTVSQTARDINLSGIDGGGEGGARLSSKEAMQLDKLKMALKILAKESSVYKICNSICNTAGKICEAKETSVFVIDENIRIHQSSSMPAETMPHKQVLGSQFIDGHPDERSKDCADPRFTSYDELAKGYKEEQIMVIPVLATKVARGGKETIYIAIQCEGKMNPGSRRKKKVFTSFDENLMHIQATYASMTVEKVVALSQEKKQGRMAIDSMGISAGLTICRDFKSMTDIISTQVRDFMQVEAVSILFFDKVKKDLQTIITEQKDEEGTEEGGADFIRFPQTMGVTGQCAMEKTQVVCRKDIKKIRNFMADIDNSAGAQNLNNFMIGALTHKNQTVGVLQLMNKKT